MTKKLNEEGLSLADRLENCYTGAVYDVLRALGYPNQTLSNQLKALDVSNKLSGQVYTVSGRYDETLEPHDTLLHWTALLSRAPKESVIMCQPNDHTLAHMGELSSETLQLRGIRGYIVDGGCRDSDFITKIGFKVFCKYCTPVDVVGRWTAESFEEPIEIDNVIINSGDYVLADRDGVVIIPENIAEEVITKTEEVLRTENLVRTAILDGEDPQKAYLKYGKF
ncbi:RraA family protein [Arenibacter sp. ARW7G5Y1]|uniref:RraA family protein n=1 Tax=Arenibacter sp. ARW7G5Y1 TaxID=2135619 RepID=UPI000D76344F|nr:RraA family protein [Arenibacter sp. ARW7G5Y1]PXX21847.1 regulator of RNase E activity RraA [Arenibacter sp. ARW7G5Y1]